MKRRTARRRNPELIRPIDALRAAIQRRDAPAVLSWFRVIEDEDIQAGNQIYADYKRAVMQHGEDDPARADYYAAAHARAHQLKALGRSEARSSHSTHYMYSNDRFLASRARGEASFSRNCESLST